MAHNPLTSDWLLSLFLFLILSYPFILSIFIHLSMSIYFSSFLMKIFMKYVFFCLIDNTKYFLYSSILSKCAKHIMLNYNSARTSETSKSLRTIFLHSKWCQIKFYSFFFFPVISSFNSYFFITINVCFSASNGLPCVISNSKGMHSLGFKTFL